MAAIKAAYGYKARPTYELKDWLSGLVRCAACGATLTAYKGVYFKCNNYCHGRCLRTQLVKIDVLHDAVINRLREDLTAEGLDYTIVRKDPERGSEAERLQSNLAELKRRDARLLDAYLSGALPLGQYTETKAALTASMTEIEDRLREKESAEATADTPQLLAESIRSALQMLTAPDAGLADKNNALRQLTERIVFDRDSAALNVTYRLIF